MSELIFFIKQQAGVANFVVIIKMLVQFMYLLLIPGKGLFGVYIS